MEWSKPHKLPRSWKNLPRKSSPKWKYLLNVQTSFLRECSHQIITFDLWCDYFEASNYLGAHYVELKWCSKTVAQSKSSCTVLVDCLNTSQSLAPYWENHFNKGVWQFIPPQKLAFSGLIIIYQRRWHANRKLTVKNYNHLCPGTSWKYEYRCETLGEKMLKQLKKMSLLAIL